KFKLGWVNPIIISNDSLYQVPAIENVPYFYILATNGDPTPECFFLENRQKVSFDQNLCNSGLLIYHIDDTIRTRNNREWYPGYTDFGHYLVAVEQADGDWDLERGVNRGDDGDPYPGSSNNRTFNDLSYPDSKNYDFGTSFIRVENISDSNDTMTCDIYVSSPTYNAAILSIDLPPDTVFAGCTYTPKATVKNCGTSNATLSVSCRIDSLWKTIYTDTVGEVFLVSGDKTQLTFCDWTVPSLGDKDQFRYKITVAAHLADDGYARDDSKVKTVVSTGLDYADHDIGNVTFTVTCWGSYGFMSVEQNQGSGFRYPVNKTNWLSYGTLIAGNSPNYVVDRIKDNDWRVSPGGRLIMGRRMYSEQDGWATFDDSNHPTPKGLTIVQDSWAWSNTPYNDFVIIRYTIKNKGVAPINGLYIGQYMDFDMDATHYESNWGAIDVGKNLAYMWWYILQPYVGVKLLDGPVSNITIIHNPTYVYPDTGLADTTAFKFLSGEISLDLATAADDYSVMVAAGPFNLDVGDSTFVAFAVLGGDNLIDLKRNAIAAQEKYNQVVGIEEVASSSISSFTLFEAVPNPMGSKTTIGYQILEESKVTLGIYNICGQLVKTLVDAVQAPGHKSVIWNGENSKGYKVASGIYFYKLNVDGYTATKKMIVVR
ncbi:MAG TPA: T9SS type A sorting domain-containing protein, partial [bacterium (Candidatus Stahlbacteria)]|nr:T9SS type A sorting domain-containing protein [Candidatus Stahlbacteria bacterium]